MNHLFRLLRGPCCQSLLSKSLSITTVNFLFPSGRILDIFIRVPNYLAVIIYQYYSARLEWTLLVFSVVVTTSHKD